MTAPPAEPPPTGYWLIEPDQLAPFAARRAMHPFARMLFAHLAEEITRRLDLTADGIALEVIEAEYHGAYPCLAARSIGGELREGLDETVEAEVAAILAETPAQSLLASLAAPAEAPERRAA